MRNQDDRPPGGPPSTLDVVGDILTESMVRPAFNDRAFDRAKLAYDEAYGRAYTAGARHALDETDRLQAHSEAHQEALEAFLAAYEQASEAA